MINKNLYSSFSSKAYAKAKEYDINDVIVLYENICNEGIIGIIASRLKEIFNKPSVVITQSGNFYKASARSTSNFNFGKALEIVVFLIPISSAILIAIAMLFNNPLE